MNFNGTSTPERALVSGGDDGEEGQRRIKATITMWDAQYDFTIEYTIVTNSNVVNVDQHYNRRLFLSGPDRLQQENLRDSNNQVMMRRSKTLDRIDALNTLLTGN